jgi:hypothetical protein
MTNHNTLFYNIMKFILDGHLAFHDLRIFQTFVWAIVGVIESKKPHFSHWIPVRGGLAKAASKERQFSRWLHNDKIRPMLIYQKLVNSMLTDWCNETAYLALDSTQLWKQFVIVRLALVYCGRAIPLGWVVCASGSATVAVRRYQRMLAQVAAQMPITTKVVLLADRGFSHIDLMKIATQLGWHFRIRLKSDTWIHLSDGKRRQIKALMPPVGKGSCYASVWITNQPYGPLHLAIAQVITPNGTEKWAIISDEPVGRHTFDEYGLRFDIEENFLDDKSAGFNLEDSQLHDSMAISRLCLILATATVYLVSTGSAVVACGLRPLVDTHWRRGLSYLQIGWRWCKHAVANRKWLHYFLWLPPNPDPEPAIASWKQFYRPTFELHTLESL